MLTFVPPTPLASRLVHRTPSPYSRPALVAAAPAGRAKLCMVAQPAARASEQAEPAALDWENLSFQYVDTRCYVSCEYNDGAWSALSLTTEPYIRLHVGATALHYGQSCFEGLKAYRQRDGKVALFRPDENAKRLNSSADRLLIPRVPTDLFLDAVSMAVRENAQYIPPYGTGGSLYVRPLLFGTGPKIGLQPSDKFTLLVMVVPVGDYYKGGLSPVTAVIMDQYDRAAPNGVGNVKVAGNYAADLLPNIAAKKLGYPINLYLDAANQRTIEEFGTSNFIGLRENTYVTPDSPSVLPSITNKTLMQLAADRGMAVERREIDIAELPEFEEAAACGTAVVITAVTRVVHRSNVITIGANPDEVGPRLKELYDAVRGIQFGEFPDTHGWCHTIQGL
jgi:branched-chain amino acid aminotransferase